MKFLPLVWRSLWRRKIRTIFTLLSIFVAFLLFGLLMTIRAAFSLGIDLAGLDRLVLIHKVSLIMPLPVSYQPRLQGVPGVELATHQTWFGGVYQDPSNFFAQIAVDPEPFLKVYPEFKVPPEETTNGSSLPAFNMYRGRVSRLFFTQITVTFLSVPGSSLMIFPRIVCSFASTTIGLLLSTRSVPPQLRSNPPIQ